jgi:hypothetical protein
MYINSIKFPNLIRHNQDCAVWSVSSRARRANILIAVGFNPRLEMSHPLTEPRSGDILDYAATRLRTRGAILYRGLKPTAIHRMCPSGTGGYALLY